MAPGFNETGTLKRGSKADLTKRELSHARGNAARDVLEDEEFNNLWAPARVKTTQFQNQSQVIPMERTHKLKSHLRYFVPEEDTQTVN